MKKSIKIALYAVFCLVLITLIAICVLLSLGYRFSPESAVHEIYRDNTHIHTDEYDFYLNDVMNDNGEPGYSDGHVAVKRYGFLYKQIKELNTEDKTHTALVAENGDSVANMYSYKGKEQTYNFIHWCGSIIESPEASNGTTHVLLKYWTDQIILNGEEKELYINCYFVTNNPIETLVIKDVNVYVVNSLVKGDYWNDDEVMVINNKADLNAEKLKAHYDNGGIIVVRNISLNDEVQIIVNGHVSAKSNEKDLAAVLCKSKFGALYAGFLQGNTSDLESEIDEMVELAKEKQ